MTFSARQLWLQLDPYKGTQNARGLQQVDGLLSMAPIGGLLEMCILTVWGLCCLDRVGSHITDRAGGRSVRAPMHSRRAEEEAPQSSRAQDGNAGAALPNSA